MPRNNRPDLDALLTKWKAVLRVCDWEITAKYARKYDLPNGVAECCVNVERNLADIRILDPNDIDPNSDEITLDVEASLVHELRHIPYHFFRPEQGTLAYSMWERSVDMDSVILTKLDRRKKKK
jgi:hypothetical protein